MEDDDELLVLAIIRKSTMGSIFDAKPILLVARISHLPSAKLDTETTSGQSHG